MTTKKINQNPDGFPSDSQIKEWKEKYGKLKAFCDTEENIILIMRPAKMIDIERANASDPSGKKSFNFNKSILTNCKLWIKEGVEDNDDLLLGIFKEFTEIINTVEVRVKEL